MNWKAFKKKKKSGIKNKERVDLIFSKMWNVFYRFETIKESFLWSCCCIQVTCVWGAFDIWVIGLNSTTSKTRPTFESLRELRLIYNREMFLRWDGLESTPRKASQAEEVALLYFLCTWRVCVCACGQGGVTSGTGVSMGGHRHEKSQSFSLTWDTFRVVDTFSSFASTVR